MSITTINPKDVTIPELHQFLLGSIGPRPICFASTVDADGNRNLAPFSFFNVFSANPPILAFSPARSGRTGKTKDTHKNCKETGEVVVNVVNYSMVQQMSLASSPYPKGVDEFVKAGFTPLESELVKPARVQESPVQMECKVLEVKEFGDGGAAGNMIICEVLRIHIASELINDQNRIDQEKIDLVARMGGNYYCRAHGDALFQIPKPITSIGVGIDALPEIIRTSDQLTGNDLGKLGQLEKIPEVGELRNTPAVSSREAFRRAKQFLNENKVQEAMNLLIKNL